VSTFSPLQDFVLKHYENGEFEHISNKTKLRHCGDTLLMYAVNEAGDASDLEELGFMLGRAIKQLNTVLRAIE